MRAVGRIFAAIFGFMAAVIAFALFLVAVSVGIEPADPHTAPWFWGQFALGTGLAASMVGAAAFVPGAILILVTEIFAIRSMIVHVGAGGLFGAAAALGFGVFADRLGTRDPTADADTLVLVAAGFVAGLVYWLVAGRMAGLEPRRDGTELTPPGPSGA